MIDPYHMLRLEATLPIKQQQQILRDAVADMLSGNNNTNGELKRRYGA